MVGAISIMWCSSTASTDAQVSCSQDRERLWYRKQTGAIYTKAGEQFQRSTALQRMGGSALEHMEGKYGTCNNLPRGM